MGPGTVSDKIQTAYLPRRSTSLVTRATNLQSTVLWRFSKRYMRDWRVGDVRNPHAPLDVRRRGFVGLSSGTLVEAYKYLESNAQLGKVVITLP